MAAARIAHIGTCSTASAGGVHCFGRVMCAASDGEVHGFGPQYNIIGQAVGPILFSDTVDGASTWFQLEGYRADLSPEALPEILPHMIDYLKYLATHRNQSRFGSSAYTDSNPLVLAPGPDAGGGPTRTA